MSSSANDESSGAAHDDISLVDTLIVLWRYKAVVIGVPLIAAAVALTLSARETPVYQAVSKVEARYPNGAPVNLADLESVKTRLMSQLMAAQIVASNPIEVDGRKLTAEEIAASIIAQSARNSPVIQIRVSRSDPVVAARLANIVAEAATAAAPPPEQPDESNETLKLAAANLERSRQQLEEFYQRAPREFTPWAATAAPTKLQTELQLLNARYSNALSAYATVRTLTPRLSLADRAVPPDAPVSPRPLRFSAVVFAIALLGAALVVLLADAVRARLRRLAA